MRLDEVYLSQKEKEGMIVPSYFFYLIIMSLKKSSKKTRNSFKKLNLGHTI